MAHAPAVYGHHIGHVKAQLLCFLIRFVRNQKIHEIQLVRVGFAHSVDGSGLSDYLFKRMPLLGARLFASA